MRWLPLLGQTGSVSRREMMEHLREGFNSELASNELFVHMIGGVALIALLLLVWQFFGRRKGPKPTPRRDFLAEAMKAIGLTRDERADLFQLAARAQLQQPAAMLLSPGNLAYALSRAPAEGPEGPFRQRLDALSRKLFGEGLPGDAKRAAAQTAPTGSSTASGNQPV